MLLLFWGTKADISITYGWSENRILHKLLKLILKILYIAKRRVTAVSSQNIKREHLNERLISTLFCIQRSIYHDFLDASATLGHVGSLLAGGFTGARLPPLTQPPTGPHPCQGCCPCARWAHTNFPRVSDPPSLHSCLIL